MSSAISYPINVKSFCTPIKTGWLKWSIKSTWILCCNKKQLLCISRMKVIRNPIQKHCFHLWLLESHGVKNPQRSKTSENSWSSWDWREINSLLSASLGWGSFCLELEACSSGIFQPSHSLLPFLRYEETQVPPPHTHLNDTWMTPEWPLCLNNDYQRCLCWLLRMAAHTAVIQSWRTQTPSMYQTLFRGFFGNNKHLERKFWFKIDSEIWDISTANLYLRSTSEMFWLLHIQLNTIAYLHKRKYSQNKFSISLAVVRQSRDFQKHDSSHLIYYSTVKIHFQ